MKLVFATGNKNKLKEIQQIVDEKFDIISLSELNFTEEIPEPFEMLDENALHKARFVAKKFDVNCFAEDTGLLVDALDGAPGVYTARYAGDHKSAADNMNKLLEELKDKSNRKARFKTVIALILNGKEYTFTGEAFGTITDKKSGASGFGYDPVFIPLNSKQTFAEMSAVEKNKISHRKKATQKLLNFLNKF